MIRGSSRGIYIYIYILKNDELVFTDFSVAFVSKIVFVAFTSAKMRPYYKSISKE